MVMRGRIETLQSTVTAAGIGQPAPMERRHRIRSPGIHSDVIAGSVILIILETSANKKSAVVARFVQGEESNVRSR